MSQKDIIKFTKKFSFQKIKDVAQINENSVQGLNEKDTAFIQNIFEIVEYSQTQNRQICAKRAHLTEDDYVTIEKIGQVHYSSNILNHTSSLESDQIDENAKCSCGCGRGFGDPLPICIKQQEEYYLGPGIILFFCFLKRLMCVILILVLFYGLFALFSNLAEDNSEMDCESPGPFPTLCHWKIISSTPAKTGKPDFMLIQLILGMVMCIIWVIALRCIYYAGLSKEQTIDDQLDSSSDYSIFIDHLPAGKYSQMEILQFLFDKWARLQNKAPLRVRSVQVIYRMNQVRKMIAKIQNISKKIISCLKDKPLNINDISSPTSVRQIKIERYIALKKELKETYESLKEFRSEFLVDSEFRKKRSSECAIIHFFDESQRIDFVRNFGQRKMTVTRQIIEDLTNCCTQKQQVQFLGKKVKISKSPEPSEIFWEHCEQAHNIWRSFFAWGICFFFIGLTYGTIMLGIHIKQIYNDFPDISVIVLIVINFYQEIIWKSFALGARFEKNKTQTESIISIMNKVYFFQCFNLIVLPIIINVAMNDNLDGPDGLVGHFHDYQLVACFFMTLFHIINIPHRIVLLIKHVKCLRRLAIKYFCRVTGDFDNIEECRDAINFLYDPPITPLASFYTYSASIVSQAAFSCHLCPIVLFYLLINLLVFYFWNRYRIFRVGKIPEMIDFFVFQQAIYFALNFPLLYGVGSLVFLNLRGDAPHFGYYIPSILCIVLWFFAIQNPFNIWKKIAMLFFHKKQELSQSTTEKIKKKPDSEGGIINQEMSDSSLPKKQSKKVEVGPIPQMKRKESYFKNVGSEEMFNLQNKLREGQGQYHNQYEQFCQRFKCEHKFSPTYSLILD